MGRRRGNKLTMDRLNELRNRRDRLIDRNYKLKEAVESLTDQNTLLLGRNQLLLNAFTELKNTGTFCLEVSETEGKIVNIDVYSSSCPNLAKVIETYFPEEVEDVSEKEHLSEIGHDEIFPDPENI